MEATFEWITQFFDQEFLLAWFAQYAYEPTIVYTAIVLLMVASSFGFPIPEEVTLVSAGIVGYMGTRPDLYTPPVEGAATVNVQVLALVCFFAVFLSDFLVYTLGRKLGTRFLDVKFMRRYKPRMEKVARWAEQYGAFAAGIFRFTPGLRFPGHFSCGMLGLSPIKFVAVDGAAALISVPTQVLLVAYFGEEILIYFKQFKIVLLSLLAVALGVFLYRRYKKKAEVQAT